MIKLLKWIKRLFCGYPATYATKQLEFVRINQHSMVEAIVDCLPIKLLVDTGAGAISVLCGSDYGKLKPKIVNKITFGYGPNAPQEYEVVFVEKMTFPQVETGEVTELHNLLMAVDYNIRQSLLGFNEIRMITQSLKW